MVSLRMGRLISGVWLLVDSLIVLAIYAIYKPTSVLWGVPESLMRVTFVVVIVVLINLPIILLLYVATANNPSWLAPKGKYIPGEKYPVWGSRRFIEIAILAALIAATEIIRLPVPAWVSLVCIAYLFGALFFNPITVIFAAFFGNIVLLLFGVAFMGVHGAIMCGVSDAATYGIASWFFLKYMYGRKVTHRVAMYTLMFVVWNLHHFLIWIGIFFPIAYGWPAVIPIVVTFIPLGYTGNIVSGIIGVLAAESALKAIGTKKSAR